MPGALVELLQICASTPAAAPCGPRGGAALQRLASEAVRLCALLAESPAGVKALFDAGAAAPLTLLLPAAAHDAAGAQLESRAQLTQLLGLLSTLLLSEECQLRCERAAWGMSTSACTSPVGPPAAAQAALDALLVRRGCCCFYFYCFGNTARTKPCALLACYPPHAYVPRCILL